MSCGDIFEFYFIHNLLHQEVERCLGRCALYLGLSVRELQVLWIAGSAGRATLAEIAKVTFYTKEQLENVVEALEQNNLVEQTRSGESLCTFILATDRGKKIISEVFTRSNSRWPATFDRPNTQTLIDHARQLLMELGGRSTCDLIADMAGVIR